ncbi:lipopolysaccharide biosynthesis protein [Geodermatophilus sp. SYSU D00684]
MAAGLLQVLFIALLARSFGVETYGRYVAFLAGVYLVMNAFDFGFGTRLLRLAAEPDAKSTTTWILLVRTVTNVLVIAAGSLVWVLVAPGSWVLGCAVTVYATGDTFGDLGLAHLLARGKVRFSAGLLVARRLATVAPFLAGLTAVQGLAALFTAGVTGWVTAYLAMRASLTRPRRFKEFVRGGVAYWGLTGVANLRQADTLLVSAVAGPTTAGLYGAATRLLGPLGLVTSVLQQVFVPRLSATSSEAERRVQWQRLLTATTVVCGCLVLSSLASPLVVRVLFGEEFEGAWPVLAAVCVAAALNAYSEAYLSWIYAAGARVRLTLSSGVVVLSGLALLTLLVGQTGITGAAVALVLTYLGLALLFRQVSGLHPAPAPAEALSVRGDT